MLQPSIQFSCSVVSDSATPWTAAHQASLSITNSWSLLKFLSIELVMPSSVVPFSFRLQSFPASESFPMSQFFTSGGQSIGVSASASVFPMNIQDWFPLGLTGLISLLSKGLSRVFSNNFSHRANVYLHEEFMWERNHINVRYVGSSSAKALTYIHTEQLTQERNPINAMHVAKNSISAFSFVYTEEHTLQRNL